MLTLLELLLLLLFLPLLESYRPIRSISAFQLQENLNVLRLHVVSAVLQLHKAVKNGSNDSYLSLDLRIQVMKLPLMHYASCATKSYQTVLCYLQNFVDVILITLNIRTKILAFSSINLGH
jgi:hypothetical protein